jgi:hypothetical protein
MVCRDRLRSGHNQAALARQLPVREASHYARFGEFDHRMTGIRRMRFTCSKCGEPHEGMHGFGWEYPVNYLAVPESERGARCVLGTDTCVVDGEHFFVRGCIEIPVHGESDPFIWNVWVSLSPTSYQQFQSVFLENDRSGTGPFFGWLQSHIWIYPETINLKTRVHLRNNGIRPKIELEPTAHPLAREQSEGIDADRVVEIFEAVTHPPNTAE